MKTQRIEELTWDSEFFGFRVGRVSGTTFDREADASAVVDEAKTRGFRCVYLLADAQESASWAAAANAGFTPIDIRLELSRDATDDSVPAELAQINDETALHSVTAGDLFQESRFYRDPRFGRDRASRLFELWISRGVREKGWFTVIERAREGIAGFVTARVRDNAGSIELAGVASSSRGQGVGRRVLAAALSELTRRGARQISVVTQGSNLAAQRLYADQKFRVSSCALWFHLWL